MVRALIRAQLQRWSTAPSPDAFVTVVQSAAVNTGSARTLSVVTPTLFEPTSPAFQPGWYRVNIRAQIRYTSGALVFQQRATYSIWLGDGPAVPAVPPA